MGLFSDRSVCEGMSSAGGFAAALDRAIPADELRSQLNGAFQRGRRRHRAGPRHSGGRSSLAAERRRLEIRRDRSLRENDP
jgi:hypothetical protein